MSDRNGYNNSAQNFNSIIQKQSQILKKLEELKIKITDLKQAKRELLALIKNFQEDIVHGLFLLEDSDSDTS